MQMMPSHVRRYGGTEVPWGGVRGILTTSTVLRTVVRGVSRNGDKYFDLLNTSVQYGGINMILVQYSYEYTCKPAPVRSTSYEYTRDLKRLTDFLKNDGWLARCF